MFELSFAEILLILIVGLVVIGPKDLPKVIKSVREFIVKAKKMAHEFSQEVLKIDEIKNIHDDLKQEVEKVNNDIKMIVDMDGNLQPTYDISDLLPKEDKAINNDEQKTKDLEEQNLRNKNLRNKNSV